MRGGETEGDRDRDDAEGFVKDANAKGAGLELGPSLGSSQPGKKTYEVDLVAAPATPHPSGSEGNGLRGSLSTYDSQGAADSGRQECEAATGLLCYQAANVVLVFESSRPNAVQQRLGTALTKLAH